MSYERNEYSKQVIQINTISQKTRKPYKLPYPPIGTTTAINDSKHEDSFKHTATPINEKPIEKDLIKKEDIELKTDATEMIEPFSEAIPFSRMSFCGIMISGLLLIGSLGYIVISVLIAFDKKGKEAYYSDDPDTVMTLTQVFAITTPRTDASLKTDYWGWFRRAHDEDSILKEYDIFYFVLGIGSGCGIICAILSIVEICKYKNDSVDRGGCVRLILINLGNNILLYSVFNTMWWKWLSLLQVP